MAYRHRRTHPDSGRPRSLFEAVRNYGVYPDNCCNNLQQLCKDDLGLVRRLASFGPPLVGHTGCVNTIKWSRNGAHILSGGDDLHLKVFDPFVKRPVPLIDFRTSHRSNIFSANFLPESDGGGGLGSRIVSCERDGDALYTDLGAPAPESSSLFRCHASTCFQVLTPPEEPHTFFTCGEDGTVRVHDLRTQSNCNCSDSFSAAAISEDVLIRQRWPVTCMASNPRRAATEIAIGLVDRVHFYDRRNVLKPLLKLRTPPTATEDYIGHRVTSVCYSDDGTELLASLNSHNLHLWEDITGGDPRMVQTFSGHRNRITFMKECAFIGRAHVASGSDCGHLFFWAKGSGKLVYVIKGDSQIVNNVQPHPTLPLIAVSGIDTSVKLCAPTAPAVESFDERPMLELVQKNRAMIAAEEEQRERTRGVGSGLWGKLTKLNPFRRRRAASESENQNANAHGSDSD